MGSRDNNVGQSLSVVPEMEQDGHQHKKDVQNVSVMAEDRFIPLAPALTYHHYPIADQYRGARIRW